MPFASGGIDEITAPSVEAAVRMFRRSPPVTSTTRKKSGPEASAFAVPDVRATPSAAAKASRNFSIFIFPGPRSPRQANKVACFPLVNGANTSLRKVAEPYATFGDNEMSGQGNARSCSAISVASGPLETISPQRAVELFSFTFQRRGAAGISLTKGSSQSRPHRGPQGFDDCGLHTTRIQLHCFRGLESVFAGRIMLVASRSVGVKPGGHRVACKEHNKFGHTGRRPAAWVRTR